MDNVKKRDEVIRDKFEKYAKEFRNERAWSKKAIRKLAEEYFLSEHSISRIVYEKKPR